jgi:hypothetical protein
VPLKILLRFVPFLIAFSVASQDQINGAASTGLFAVLCGDVAGQWLRTWSVV